MKTRVHEQAYFILEGRLKKLLMLIDRCGAKNQMWQPKRARRNRFINKAKPFVNKRISNAVYKLGYKTWWVERTGSNNLYDVEAMRNQYYRVMMENKRQETTE